MPSRPMSSSEPNAHRPFVIGVAGGTGSGKTTVSRRIQEHVGAQHIAYIMHDSYYHDRSKLPQEGDERPNFDHPNSLDTALLIEQVMALIRGEAVEIPIYDFTTDTRRAETQHMEPAPVILIEGILVFWEKALRELMDMRIYVDTDADIRFIRRMHRDVNERGRTLESVVSQYLTTVRPMHLEFVEPSKRYADIMVPKGGNNRVAMEMIVSRIQAVLAQRR